MRGAYFRAIRLRPWLLAILTFLCAGCVWGVSHGAVLLHSGIGSSVEAISVSLVGEVILLDAGHGGFDPGAIGVDGTQEKDVNLAVSRRLADYLRQAGATVVETRSDDSALADTKKGDMARRVQIAEESGAELFISVQANSIPQHQYRGAQVFYHKSSAEGRLLAESIQSSITERLENTTRLAMSIEDIFVVRSVAIPSIIVEVGFLSNPEEEELLNSGGYQNEMAYAIFCGILDYYAGEPQA